MRSSIVLAVSFSLIQVIARQGLFAFEHTSVRKFTLHVSQNPQHGYVSQTLDNRHCHDFSFLLSLESKVSVLLALVPPLSLFPSPSLLFILDPESLYNSSGFRRTGWQAKTFPGNSHIFSCISQQSKFAARLSSGTRGDKRLMKNVGSAGTAR